MRESISRRRLLVLLPALTGFLWRMPLFAQSKLFSRRPKAKPPGPPSFVYIGTDTDKPGARGIYLSRFNAVTGNLSQPMLVAESLRPSFLASARVGQRHLVYAANESNAANSSVSSFLMDPVSGALQPIGKVPAGGAGPCYLAVDGSASAAFTANYDGGSVSTFKVKPDGTLSQPVQVIDFKQKDFGDHGPNKERQEGPHPHSATISPDDRFLIVNDLGNDDIVTFPIHLDTAHLGAPHLSETRDGTGPRHIAFHPNGRWVYGVDELASRISHYLWNATHGSGTTEPQALLTHSGEALTTFAPSYHGANFAAEIAITPEGDYAIVSNRGEDSLASFHIDPLTGALSFAQRISCGGHWPRHFTLDPTGRWLLCNNQNSASITIFARNENTGLLSGPVQTIAIESPLMALFV